MIILFYTYVKPYCACILQIIYNIQYYKAVYSRSIIIGTGVAVIDPEKIYYELVMIDNKDLL